MDEKRMFFWAVVLLLSGLLMIGLTGCDSGDEVSETEVSETEDSETEDRAVDEEAVTDGEEREKLTVAVTIVPQQAFVKEIAGDLVDVVLMVPPGNSPGNYEPTPQEIQMFSDAAVYFSIGTPTEEPNILPHAEEMGTIEVVRLQDVVAAKYPDREISPGRRDAHIWLSPKRAMVMVETMAEKISSLDETNRQTYEQNAAMFISQLEELDQYLLNTLDNLSSNKFIVFHPAFGYLADDYGLEMYALEQDGKEATPERLKEMIDFAKGEGIKVIFYQKEIDSPQSRSFAEEIGGETIRIAPLSPDYIDNLKKIADTMAEVLG